MANIPVTKLQLFAYGYNRKNFKVIHQHIIRCFILYLNGDEGIPATAHEVAGDKNISIAEQDIIAGRELMDSIDVRIYFDTAPTRREFCIKMRNDHNAKQGRALKAYQYLCSQPTLSAEGIESKEKGNETITGAYKWKPSIEHDSKEPELNGLQQISKEKDVSLSIFIDIQSIKELRGLIAEKFENESILYRYININTTMQINEHEMIEFTILMDGEEVNFGIISFDLHAKGINKILYGIITPNDNNKIQQNKRLWKLSEFMTVGEIFDRFHIKSFELPVSCRQMPQFIKQSQHHSSIIIPR